MKKIITKQMPSGIGSGEGWQTGKDGRRFRKVGNTIEYEMEFSFPQEKKKKGSTEEKKPEQNRYTGKSCPFKKGYSLECFTDCAFYGKAACALSLKEVPPETSNKDCPFSGRKCNETCAMFSNGCELIKIIKGEQSRKGQK